MPKLRVYQLARELNRDNSEIIRELQHLGVPVTSHSNTVEDRIADKLRRDLGVYSPDSGARVSAGDDDFIAVDVPATDIETLPAPAEPVPVTAEPPRVEANTDIKVEAKPEPKIEEKAPEPKIAAPPAPAATAPPQATAPPPAASAVPPAAPPKVAH